MRVAVTGGKGGTGKSTVATSLAIEFAKTQEVMLVDADVECPNDHLLLSVKRKRDKSIYQLIPKWDKSKCIKCGKCASVCKQEAIVFVKGKHPVFLPDLCIGCGACIVSCPTGAITKSRKRIGTIYAGSNYDVNLVSGELKLGELASGEVVSEVRERADELFKSGVMVIDSAAGIGCPVIASLKGTDFVVAVTEPTPSALHDLKRVLYLAEHFKIPHGIVINKSTLDKGFRAKIERFAKGKGIPILGEIPYSQDFVKSTIKMKPVIEINPDYELIFKKIIMNINSKTKMNINHKVLG